MKTQLLSLMAVLLLMNCGRKELPPFEVFIKQGDRIMKAMDQEVALAANDFTLLLTFGHMDSSRSYGIQWVASAEPDVMDQFRQATNLASLHIPFTDTLQPESGQIITAQPVLMEYEYALNDQGERIGNFTKTEEKFQQLLLEVNIDQINGQQAADWSAQRIGLFITPMYDHMPMDPFYIHLNIEP